LHLIIQMLSWMISLWKFSRRTLFHLDYPVSEPLQRTILTFPSLVQIQSLKCASNC